MNAVILFRILGTYLYLLFKKELLALGNFFLKKMSKDGNINDIF